MMKKNVAIQLSYIVASVLLIVFVFSGVVFSFASVFVKNLNNSTKLTAALSGPATLTVITKVNNSHGGTKKASDFSVNVIGYDQIKQELVDVSGSPAPGSTAGVRYTLQPGYYNISEDKNVSYIETFGGDCENGIGGINLSAGDQKTCIVTNYDVDTAAVCAYYKFDEVTIDGYVAYSQDAFESGYFLVPDYSAKYPYTTDGRVGNARTAKGTTFNGVGLGSFHGGVPPKFSHLQSGNTIFGWWKMVERPTDSTHQNNWLTVISNGPDWQIYGQGDNLKDGTHFTMSFSIAGKSISFSELDQTKWHFIVMSVDPKTSIASVSIDAGISKTATLDKPLAVYDPLAVNNILSLITAFTVSSFNSSYQYIAAADEWGFVKGTLTTDQITKLFNKDNSGVGKGVDFDTFKKIVSSCSPPPPPPPDICTISPSVSSKGECTGKCGSWTDESGNRHNCSETCVGADGSQNSICYHSTNWYYRDKAGTGDMLQLLPFKEPGRCDPVCGDATKTYCGTAPNSKEQCGTCGDGAICSTSLKVKSVLGGTCLDSTNITNKKPTNPQDPLTKCGVCFYNDPRDCDRIGINQDACNAVKDKNGKNVCVMASFRATVPVTTTKKDPKDPKKEIKSTEIKTLSGQFCTSKEGKVCYNSGGPLTWNSTPSIRVDDTVENYDILEHVNDIRAEGNGSINWSNVSSNYVGIKVKVPGEATLMQPLLKFAYPGIYNGGPNESFCLTMDIAFSGLSAPVSGIYPTARYIINSNDGLIRNKESSTSFNGDILRENCEDPDKNNIGICKIKDCGQLDLANPFKDINNKASIECDTSLFSDEEEYGDFANKSHAQVGNFTTDYVSKFVSAVRKELKPGELGGVLVSQFKGCKEDSIEQYIYTLTKNEEMPNDPKQDDVAIRYLPCTYYNLSLCSKEEAYRQVRCTDYNNKPLEVTSMTCCPHNISTAGFTNFIWTSEKCGGIPARGGLSPYVNLAEHVRSPIKTTFNQHKENKGNISGVLSGSLIFIADLVGSILGIKR